MHSRRQIFIGHGGSFHDPGVAVIENDKVFAEAIERHTQCKRALEMPRLWYSWRAVRKALASLGIEPVRDAEVVALNSWSTDKLMGVGRGLSDRGLESWNEELPLAYLSQVACDWLEPLFVSHMDWILRERPPQFDWPATPREDLSWQTKEIDHHLAHAANAVYTSPFDECVVMIIDGHGEDRATSFFHFKDNSFKRLDDEDRTGRADDSLGWLWMRVTDLCGFNYLEGEEWKVMGLAPYGKLNHEVYDFFDRHVEINGLSIDHPFYVGTNEIREALEPMLGELRAPGDPEVMKAADLAHSFQAWYVDAVVRLLETLGGLGLSRNLAIGGGCALNSSANGQILERCGQHFDRLHVPSAPADDGNALGVALYEKHCTRGIPREPAVMSPYLGSDVDLDKLRKILGFEGVPFRELADARELCEVAAELLEQGKIIGWMQGRAEHGPRALGNRSILASPAIADMKDQINARVKFREWFRPLAPSILHEHGPEYFEGYQESPYMERTLRYRDEVCGRVPAVVHQNRTGRLHSVRKEHNPLYHQLIQTFYERTGIPILLNTSFNVMGRPIIHSVEDALTVFYTTGLDTVFIGRFMLLKQS